MGGTPSILIHPTAVKQPIASHTSELGSSHEWYELGLYRSLEFHVGELEGFSCIGFRATLDPFVYVKRSQNAHWSS
jgi:hypothetical protein